MHYNNNNNNNKYISHSRFQITLSRMRNLRKIAQLILHEKKTIATYIYIVAQYIVAQYTYDETANTQAQQVYCHTRFIYI